MITENWLDVLVALAAGLSVMIGLVSTWKTMGQSQSDEGEQPGTSPLQAVGQARSDLAIPPQLGAARVALQTIARGEAVLELSLVNVGKPLMMHSISIQEDNELEVEWSTGESYPDDGIQPGHPISFRLRGHDAEDSTYHFRVIYSDPEGNTYSQGIAGWGSETPIVETPLQIDV